MATLKVTSKQNLEQDVECGACGALTGQNPCSSCGKPLGRTRKAKAWKASDSEKLHEVTPEFLTANPSYPFNWRLQFCPAHDYLRGMDYVVRSRAIIAVMRCPDCKLMA